MLVIRIIGNHVGQDALAEPHVVVVAQQHSQFAAQRGEQRGMLLRREVVQLVGIGRIVEHQHAFERPVAADTQLHRMRCGLHAARLGEEAADQAVGIAPAVEVAHVKGCARAFGLHGVLPQHGRVVAPLDTRGNPLPEAGLSWNFNRENLLKKSEWMSNGKLRLSWGLTGNNRTQTPYDFYSQITVNPGSGNSLDYVFGGERVPGYYVSNMANERLKWETTEQWNAGLDLGFFEDRIKVTADWYDKVTRDLLLYALLPASSGFEQGMLNIGKIRNRGFELTLETVNVKTRQFQWSTSFNIAFNRNRILGLVDGQNTLQSSVSWETRFNSQFPYISQVGKPTGMMYGFIYDGTYKAEDFDDKGNLVSGVPSFKGNAMQPGDMKYRDMNGDGVIDDYDRTIIGCGQPLNTGGFGNNFNWKNFDLNIFFAWSYGNDVLNANRLVFESGWRSQTNQLASYADRWSPENPASNIPRVNAVGREEYSSRVIEDGSFLRLKNVSLGYTLPSRSLRKAGISQMRVYVSADNIWTLTGYSGPDPEVSTRNSVLTPGFDWSAYPRAFGFTAGVNLTF